MAKQLSPATQAVLNAFGKYPLHGDHIANNLMYGALPSAIEALANEVVPEDKLESFGPGGPQSFAIQRRATRRQILDIAAELRGQDQPTRNSN